jgi:hypothetical protein
VNRYEYRGQIYTVKELSEMSGIAPHTLRDRLRRGYSVDQAIRLVATESSVEAFCEASWWEDWIGMSSPALYEIYWKWCVSHEYQPVSQKGFSRQLMAKHPQLHIVPMAGVRYIRLKS